jgi:hypothetical protein
MNVRALTRDSGLRVAVGALVVAVIAMGWTVIHALRVEAIPDAPPTTVASLQGVAHGPTRGRTDISTVVENDLFSPDRSAPAAPYRMPGEPGPGEKSAMPDRPVLLGTGVATDNHSFATVQLGAERPTLVHVGDKIGQWSVKAIERNKIVLVTADGARAEVTVPKTGS